MHAAQPIAKIYAAPGPKIGEDLRAFIPVFHRWIQERRTDELLIDVHDYSHVHEGPGIILVAHECIYAIDSGEGRLGLAFKRRRRGEGTIDAEAALADSLCRAARGCQLLESDVEGLTFSSAEVYLGFDDRLNAPGTPETFARLRPALESLAQRVFPNGGICVDDASEPRGPFRARIRGEGATLASLALGAS